MSWQKLKPWLKWILFSEFIILIVAYKWYLPARRYSEPNTIVAQWILDDPSLVETLVLYMVLLHVALAVLFPIGYWSAKRKARREERD